jgi:hypothetical protein
VKGTITTCLAEMVEKKHGSAAWAQILEEAEVDPKTARLPMLPVSDIDDAVVLALLQATCSVLGITLEQAADAFGEYSCCTYAPKVYKPVVEKLKKSKRNLLPVYVGLAKGLGKYFRETVAVTVIARDRARIVFGAAR